MILCAFMSLMVVMLKILVIVIPLTAIFEVLKLMLQTTGRKYRR